MAKPIQGPHEPREYHLRSTEGDDRIMARGASEISDYGGNDAVVGTKGIKQVFYTGEGTDEFHFGSGDLLFVRSLDGDPDTYIFQPDEAFAGERTVVLGFDLGIDELILRGVNAYDLNGPVEWNVTDHRGQQQGDYYWGGMNWLWTVKVTLKDGTTVEIDGGSDDMPDPAQVNLKIPGVSDDWWIA